MNYNFNNTTPDAKSVIHLIAQQGDNLIGLELGVLKGESLCCILDSCPNVKTLYGIDNWEPYDDYLAFEHRTTPLYSADKKTQEVCEFLTYHNIKWCDNGHKAKIIKEDSNKCLGKFKNTSLDFIFFDAYMTREQAMKDLELWIPKIKKGGLVIGHDWTAMDIQKTVHNYREKHNIKNILSVYDNTWVWRK